MLSFDALHFYFHGGLRSWTSPWLLGFSHEFIFQCVGFYFPFHTCITEFLSALFQVSLSSSDIVADALYAKSFKVPVLMPLAVGEASLGQDVILKTKNVLQFCSAFFWEDPKK